MKYLLIISAILIFNLTQIYSQLKEGNHLAEVTVGYSDKSHNIIFGADYEYEFLFSKAGNLGLGALTRCWFSSEDILNNTAKLKNTFIIIGAQANYNFNIIDSQKLIPFAGVTFGYKYSDAKYSSNNNTPLLNNERTVNGSLFTGIEAGLRYFVSDHILIALRLGIGNSSEKSINAGFGLKL